MNNTLIALGMILVGIFLLAAERRGELQTGVKRQGLGIAGWVLIVLGGLALIGIVTGQ